MTQLQALRRIDPSLTRKGYKALAVKPYTTDSDDAILATAAELSTQRTRAYRASRAVDKLALPRPAWYVPLVEASHD